MSATLAEPHDGIDLVPNADSTFGGFDFAPLMATVDPAIRRSPFAMMMLRLLAATFVTSAGRQYAQLCDMAALAAMLRAKRCPVDWEIVMTDAVVPSLARWPLPGGHTEAPLHTRGQVQGIYHFWWRAFCDVIAAQWWRVPLPSDDELDDRMEIECGVPWYATSSTTGEERAAIFSSYAVLRDNPGWTRAGIGPLIRGCVARKLAEEMHWQSHKRPVRRTEPGAPRRDVHELGVRSHILAAIGKPHPTRTVYDELFQHLQHELTRVASPHAAFDPALAKLHVLYHRVLAAYNANHPGAPIEYLHR